MPTSSAPLEIGRVALTVNDGAAVTTQFSDWATLVNPPELITPD